MSNLPTPITAENLLEHSDWVRALARSLVSDPNLADDVAQEAWVGALRAPPADGRNVRGWLARVVRNAAFQVKRSESRRGARERAASRAEAAPDTAELVERASLQRELAGHVLALEEPYRRAVLLRWFEGHEAAAIARMEGVPLATVRTRLQRGIAKLRERLDRQHGDRSKWLPAVAALASKPAEAAAATGSVAWIVLAAAGVSAVAITGAAWLYEPGEIGVEPVAAAGALVSEQLEASEDPPPREPSSRGETAVPVAPTADALRELPRSRVLGRVVDLSGSPIAGFAVRARDRCLPRREDGRLTWFSKATGHSVEFGPDDERRMREVPGALEAAARSHGDLPGMRQVMLGADLSSAGTTAADGSFELEVLGAEPDVVSDDPRWVFAIEGWAESRSVRVFVAAPAIDVSGRVLDESGANVGGAHVRIGTSPVLFPLVLEDASGESWSATTAEDGTFRLAGIPAIVGSKIDAWKRGYRPTRTPEPDQSTDDLTIVLEEETTVEGPHVRGIVLDQDGNPAPEAWVQLGQDSGTSDAGGRFDLELTITPNEGTPLTATKKGSQAAVIERFDEQLSPGADDVVLRLGGGPLVISGVVLDAEGRGQCAWIVDLEDGTPSGTSIGNVEGATLGRLDPAKGPRTDAGGCFQVGGLRDRTYRLRAWNEASCLVLVSEPVAAGTKGVELRIPADAVRSLVRGRVVSKRGFPVADAQVAVAYVTSRTPDGGYSSRSCEPVHTGQDGAFELANVPRRNVFLSVHSSMVDTTRVEIPPDASGDDVRIEVEVQCRLRVEPRYGDPVDRIEFLDAQGMPLRVTVHRPDVTSMVSHLRRGEDGFPIATVSENASVLVLRQGDRELRRVPIDLQPGEVQIVVP